MKSIEITKTEYETKELHDKEKQLKNQTLIAKSCELYCQTENPILKKHLANSIYSLLYHQIGIQINSIGIDSLVKLYSLDDIRQLVFEKVFKSIYSCKNFNNLRPWINSITRNTIIDLLRKQKHNIHDSSLNIAIGKDNDTELINLLPCTQTKLMNTIESAEIIAKMYDLIDQINPVEQSEILKLWFLEEKSYENIAMLINIPIGTVKSRISNGKSKLKILVKNYFRVEHYNQILKI